MTPKFYRLDLRKCDKKILPKHVRGLDFLSLMDGQYYADFDVIEDDLPADVCNYARYESDFAKDLKKHFSYSECALVELDSLPFGLSRNQIPPGAILIEL